VQHSMLFYTATPILLGGSPRMAGRLAAMLYTRHGVTLHWCGQGLHPLEPFTAKDCRAIIGQVEKKARECKEKYDTSLFFCGDELYIKARMPLHSHRYYEDFPQLENGVGMLASMRKEFEDALEDVEPDRHDPERVVSLATGSAAFAFIQSMVDPLIERRGHFWANVYRIENEFFGPEVTVAGLITGQDLVKQLKGKDLGECLFLPSVMLRADGEVFLDDMTPAQLEEELGVPVEFIDNDGAQFIEKLLGMNE